MAQGETCYNCMYAVWDPGLWIRTLWSGFPARATCGNQPDYPGRMRECPPRGICPNYRRKPPTPTGPAVKTIPLGEGFYTYVDAADFEWLNPWTWHLQNGYAVRLEGRKRIPMHRQILQPPEGMVVDHKNRNRLDNTRANLRVCTPQENARNRAKRRDSSSRFKGVSRHKNGPKYYATVYYQDQPLFLGLFTEEIDAARACDYKTVELFGESAWLNLPEEWPPERVKRVHAQWLRAQARLKAKVPRTKGRGSKHKNRKSPITNRKSKALRAQAREKAKEPRPRSKKSKHKNRKSQITNHKSKAPRPQARPKPKRPLAKPTRSAPAGPKRPGGKKRKTRKQR